MHTFLICFRYSEKVTDGGVGIREHKHNHIDLRAMEEGRTKKKMREGCSIAVLTGDKF